MTSQLLVIGIIGGIASGKSEVAKQLIARGAVSLNADAMGHELLANDLQIRQAILAEFGPSVMDTEEKIDRKRIAAFVFGRDEESRHRLSFLESILHPAIRAETEARLAAFKRDPKTSIVIIDAPLLVEAGWEALCDEIVFVDAPIELRRRLASYRGWSVDEFERREALQLSLEEKRSRASRILVNDGDLDELHRKIDDLFRGLKSSSRK